VRFIGRGLVTSETRNAAQVIEKFAKCVQLIIPAPSLETVQSRGEIDCFHQCSPNSRTKSSNRRLAAVSSRKATK
jgi:hypothetical protein